MLFGLFYYDWTILLVLPALIISIWAQIKVSRTYEHYSKLFVGSRMTGAEAARRVLDSAGLHHVEIERIGGHLTDHYDPRKNIIRLSESVFDSPSAAAIGVAAHEAGHAMQYAKGYAPIKLRSAILPVTRYGSILAIPLFLIGLLFANYSLAVAGILLYSTIALFQLLTLPVEFNASARALETLRTNSILTGDELEASRKVLSAAALTYVAALLTSLLTILRLLFILGGRNRR